MVPTFLLPPVAELSFEQILIDDTNHQLAICLRSTQGEPCCPLCQEPSDRRHSHYSRRLGDLPVAGYRVSLHLTMRKFFCDTSFCPRRIFTERLPHLTAPSARRTRRLATEQRQMTLEHGAEATARTAQRHGMAVSPRTLLRLVRRTPIPTYPTPRVLGVDDFAFRKGQTYGTLLVDLEQHQPIDMLPDRSAEQLAQWLDAHPGVEIISRDRANEYAEGAARGAPAAIQVADRFHLLQNVREMLQRFLERHQAALQAATKQEPVPPVRPMEASMADGDLAVATTPCAEPAVDDVPAPINQDVPALSGVERARARHRTARLARYHEVRTLHDQGLSVRDIARQLRMSRKTVRCFVVADQFPERASRRKVISKLDPYLPYLRAQLAAGQRNAQALWRHIRDHQGYTGSRALVTRWVAQHRHLCPAVPLKEARAKRPTKASVRPQERRLSARQAAWLLVRRPADLEPKDQQIVACLCQQAVEIQSAYDTAQAFIQMVRDHSADGFAAWLAAARSSTITEVKNFALCIARDQAAVTAGLSLPWSNGQTEGQITRLKFIKRSGYGRAKFDLLRHRVLGA